MTKLFLQTFGMILLMEMGSRSQFTIAALASHSDRPFIIWIASLCALATTCFLAIVFGKFMEQLPFSPNLLSGTIMTILGVYLLWNS